MGRKKKPESERKVRTTVTVLDKIDELFSKLMNDSGLNKSIFINSLIKKYFEKKEK